MKTCISILAVLLLCASAFAQSQGVSMRGTNGHGYGTTIIESLVGKIASGNATNASGSRVAYLEDVTGSTNGIFTTMTNIAAYQAFLATNNYGSVVTGVFNSLFPATGMRTNQFTTNTMFETIQTDGGTNFSIAIGTIYKKIVATNDVAFTNVTGQGSASVRILPNTADRFVYFPTNWAWLDTNNFTLSGSQWRTGITNGVSRIGWLSIVADGASETNVAAKWIATP